MKLKKFYNYCPKSRNSTSTKEEGTTAPALYTNM